MKKTLNRITAIAAALLIASGSFVSCGESSVNTADEGAGKTSSESVSTEAAEAAAEDEEELKPDIPEGYSFGGKTFRIMCNDYSVPGWAQRDIYAEEMNGNVINDAVFSRNTYVEETYECAIEEYRVTDYGFSGLGNLVKAGDSSVDIGTTLFWQGAVSNLALNGYLVQLNTVESMNLGNPWYDQMSVDYFTIMDRIYFVVCDMTIGDRIATAGMVFNKQLYEDYQYSTRYGNIYDLVREGKWTHEVLRKMVLDLSEDLNSDGKMDNEDFYGLLYQRDSLPSFINAYGMIEAQINTDGVPEYTLINDNNANKLDSMFEFLYHQDNCFHVMNWFDKTATDFTTGMVNMFEQNQAMFMWIRFADVEMMRSMDMDFGIVPVPKWDELQDRYYSTVNQHMGIATILPASCEDPVIEGYFIEATACESKKTLIPAYYDVTLQGKVTRDVESREMLDVIFDNRIYDIGAIFNIGNFGADIYNMTVTYNSDYTQIWAKGQKMYSKLLERFIKSWQEIGE